MRLRVHRKQNNLLPVGVRFYTVVIALLPVLASYASGIPGLSLADLVLVLFCAVKVLGKYNERRNAFAVKPVLIAAALYLIVLFSLISALVQHEPEISNIIIRTIRYFFYLFVVVFCSRYMLDIELCKKTVKTITVIACVFIFVQFLMYNLFGVIIRGYLPFLRLYVEGYAATDYAAIYTKMYRPTSFFLEPAHFARYAVVGTALTLFGDEKLKWKNVVAAVFISAAILISTSAQGYMLIALVWIICLATRVKALESNSMRAIFVIACILLPILLIGILRLPFVQTAVMRALNIDFSNLANENTALGARLGGFAYYADLPVGYKLIGMGFGVVPKSSWLSSAAYWLYGSGCIVFILYMIYMLMCIKKLKGASRVVFLLFFILFFSDDSFYSYMCVLFISLSLIRPAVKVQTAESGAL
ncbi:MAG: hypothetical protein IJ017_00015 [Oscillospiraceae bacterium]|nr:hypothetical protein [Oscillospiraceae bacterium]